MAAVAAARSEARASVDALFGRATPFTRVAQTIRILEFAATDFLALIKLRAINSTFLDAIVNYASFSWTNLAELLADPVLAPSPSCTSSTGTAAATATSGNIVDPIAARDKIIRADRMRLSRKLFEKIVRHGAGVYGLWAVERLYTRGRLHELIMKLPQQQQRHEHPLEPQQLLMTAVAHPLNFDAATTRCLLQLFGDQQLNLLPSKTKLSGVSNNNNNNNATGSASTSAAVVYSSPYDVLLYRLLITSLRGKTSLQAAAGTVVDYVASLRYDPGRPPSFPIATALIEEEGAPLTAPVTPPSFNAVAAGVTAPAQLDENANLILIVASRASTFGQKKGPLLDQAMAFIKLLMSKGVDPNCRIRNEHNATPLITAVWRDVSEEDSAEFVRAFACLPEVDPSACAERNTALTACVDRQRNKFLEAICSRGPGPYLDSTSTDFHTALQKACQYARTKSAQILLAAGANPNYGGSRPGGGPPPLGIAIYHCSDKIELVKLLIDAGASLEFRLPFSDSRHSYATAMDLAHARGFGNVTKLLETYKNTKKK